MTLKEQITTFESPAILLGNGINRLQKTIIDWKTLLHRVGGSDLNFEGLTYNEVYDFIELRDQKEKRIKEKVKNELLSPPSDLLSSHKIFLNLVQCYGCPVLTTNFDLSLKIAGNLKKFRTNNKGFTQWYPWDIYYSINRLISPTNGFGIWHIHGSIDYVDSLRMGLSDYMGCVEKSRNWFHKGEASLFRGKDMVNWRGRHTWLHIWFNNPLIIVGLELSSQEVFVRWLLIERERYFKKFSYRRKPTVFMNTDDDPSILNFLANFNINHIVVQNYSDLYR